MLNSTLLKLYPILLDPITDWWMLYGGCICTLDRLVYTLGLSRDGGLNRRVFDSLCIIVCNTVKLYTVHLLSRQFKKKIHPGLGTN